MPQENGSLIRTGKLAYYHTSKDAKDTPDDGVTIPLHETMSVKPGERTPSLGRERRVRPRVCVGRRAGVQTRPLE